MLAKRKAKKAEEPPAPRPKKHRKTQNAKIEQSVAVGKIKPFAVSKIETIVVSKIETVFASLAEPAAASTIERLPTEILFMIAHSLPSVTDVARLSQTSKTMHGVLNDAEKSFWWQHFASIFDKHASAPSASDFARQSRIYQFLMKGLIFQDDGRRGPWCDTRTFTAIKLLINEAYSHGKQQSGNIDTMTTLVKKQNLFGNLFRPSYYQISVDSRAKFLGPALLTMLHIGLDVWTPGLPTSVYSFVESKATAYHHPYVYPLFIHPDGTGSLFPTAKMRPHATNLLLIANFFRFYLRGYLPCGDLARCYSELPVECRPNPWSHHLQSEINPLERTTYWKGCAAYMNHNSQKRWRSNGGHANDDKFMTETDEFDEDVLRARGFLDLRLDFLTEDRRWWPEDFENQIGLAKEVYSVYKADNDEGVWTDKADINNAPFIGFSRSSTEAIVSGNMHPLDETAGINGFKRISWMCSAANTTGFGSSTTEILREVNEGTLAETKFWAYEGVMLPGGNIIIGRWWNPSTSWEPSIYPAHDSAQSPYVPRTFTDLITASNWPLLIDLAKMDRLETGPFIYWRVKDRSVDGIGSR